MPLCLHKQYFLKDICRILFLAVRDLELLKRTFSFWLMYDCKEFFEKCYSSFFSATNPVIGIAGFEASNESRYVLEISEKLANFDIQTDTDISLCPTDAGD